MNISLFRALGVNLFAARLVPVIFSVLSLWAVFELTYQLYKGKVAILSTIMLGVMPGFFWLSGIALTETMLVFFTTTTILFFYRWITTHQNKMLVLSGLTLGLGFLTKYQMIVSALILLFSIFFLARNQIKYSLKKFCVIIGTAVLVVTPWIIIACEITAKIKSMVLCFTSWEPGTFSIQ